MTTLFTGHRLAAGIDRSTRSKVHRLGRSPRCAVLFTPGNAPMAAYLRRQQGAAARLGIDLAAEPYAPTPAAVLAQVLRLREDAAVDAILPLHPLPEGADPARLAAMIGAEKDADGLHPLNAGRAAQGDETAAPPTARACRHVLSALLPDLRGANVVIVGASRIVGRPLAGLLLEAEATVSVCHAATRMLADHTARADVVVSAAGVPGLIGAEHVRKGAILLDVAVIRQGDRLVGDVDLGAVEGRAAIVTHVPDGVGPVTTAFLFDRVCHAAGGQE